MKVLIIEDEKLATDNLISLLKKLDPGLEIVKCLESVEESIEWFQNNSAPDLIFLDIHLADDISFKIFNSVDIKSPIIFTTAYDEYALRAFKLNSVDYLLKPIDETDLSRSLNKWKELRIDVTDFQALMSSFSSSETHYQKRFIVSSGERIKSIPVEKVAYFYGQDKYVFLTTQNGDQNIVDHTLSELEGLLNPNDFFRINRQFIIRFDAIKNMYAYSRGRVKVELIPSSKEEAVVSIDRSGSFKKWLNR